MEWIARKTGLGFNRGTIARTANEKPIYHLTIVGFDALVAFLAPMLPYLVAKKERAKLLIAYCQSRMNTLLSRTRYGKSAYTSEEIALAERVIALNNVHGHYVRGLKCV